VIDVRWSAWRAIRFSSFMQFELFGRVETSRRFIEQQQGRLAASARASRSAAEAMGRARYQLVGAGTKPTRSSASIAVGQCCVAPCPILVLPGRRHDLDILQRRHRPEQADVLKRPAEAGRRALMRGMVVCRCRRAFLPAVAL